MPTIATRGGASARGFGFSGIKTNVTSQTFTSSTTWVAPVGVTSLLAVIGKGQDGGGDYQAGIEMDFNSVSSTASGSGPASLPIPWSAIAQSARLTVERFNIIDYSPNWQMLNRQFTFYSNGTLSWVDDNQTFPYYAVVGTWSLQSYGGAPNPPSGNANYGASGTYYASGVYIAPGGAGANTTGFGFTFPGGGISGSYPNQVGIAASPASYTNVAVTPGASYSLSIPDNGYITIQYLS